MVGAPVWVPAPAGSSSSSSTPEDQFVAPYEALKVKNRSQENLEVVAGYRNVAILVRIQLPSGKPFVCELQIDVYAYHRVKCELGGHTRYVEWRNLHCD